MGDGYSLMGGRVSSGSSQNSGAWWLKGLSSSSTVISTSWGFRKQPRRRSITRIRIGQRTCRCSLLWRSTPRCKRTFVFWEPCSVFTEEWRGLRKLFDLSDRAHPTVQVVNHLDTFVDVHGKAVVIGDAAHAAPVSNLNGLQNCR